jgi:hypothetical protein
MDLRFRVAVMLCALSLTLAACGPQAAPSPTPSAIPTPAATPTPPPPTEPHGLYPDYTLAFNLEWGKWTVLNLEGNIVAVWDCPDCFEREER